MEVQIKEGKYNPVLAEYCSTYSGSAGIQLFLKMSKFLEIMCLKCQNLEKLKEKTKDKNWWKLINFLFLANPPL
jgi:hypothetical protein